jgi:hypothetical protein
MGDPRDDDKNKETPLQDTPPPIPVISPISREEHLASLDTLKYSMRLDMKAMFEEYIGKKPPRPTDPNTTQSVDLIVREVKPSNHMVLPPTKITVPYLRKMMVWLRVRLFHPPNIYSTPLVHYPMPHINNMGSPPKL